MNPDPDPASVCLLPVPSESVHSFSGSLSGVRAKYAPSIQHAVYLRCEGLQQTRQVSFPKDRDGSGCLPTELYVVM